MKGGKREGAGRKLTAPHLKKMPIAVALPQWLLDWMGTQVESRAILIEEALRRRHKIKPPQVGVDSPVMQRLTGDKCQ